MDRYYLQKKKNDLPLILLDASVLFLCVVWSLPTGKRPQLHEATMEEYYIQNKKNALAFSKEPTVNQSQVF